MISAPTNQHTLLDELDARQDEVLEQLSELDKRVAALLNECLAERNDVPKQDASQPG